MNLIIDLATNEEGPEIGKLAEPNGFNPEYVDWSNVAPWWLVAKENEKIVGAIQVIPSKPMGRLEMLIFDTTLNSHARGRVMRALLEQGIGTLRLGGCWPITGFVPFEHKSYKRLLKKRGAKVDGSGNMIVFQGRRAA